MKDKVIFYKQHFRTMETGTFKKTPKMLSFWLHFSPLNRIYDKNISSKVPQKRLNRKDIPELNQTEMKTA